MVKLTMPPHCTPLAGPGATSPRCRPRGARGGRTPSRSAPPGTPGRAAPRASPPAAHTRLGPALSARRCVGDTRQSSAAQAARPVAGRGACFTAMPGLRCPWLGPAIKPPIDSMPHGPSKRSCLCHAGAGPPMSSTCAERHGRTMGYDRYARALAVALCNALERSGISSMRSFNRLRTGRRSRGCHLRLGVAAGSTATTGSLCRQHNSAAQEECQLSKRRVPARRDRQSDLFCGRQGDLAEQPAVAASAAHKN